MKKKESSEDVITRLNIDSDRMLPHDLDSETFLLEACFCPGGISKVAKLITPDDFYSEGGKLILSKMMKFHQSGRGFTPYLIDQSFLGHQHYDCIRRILDTLVPVTAESATHFAKIVRQLSIRRQMIRAAYTAYESLYDPSTSLEQFAGLFEKSTNVRVGKQGSVK